MPSCPLGGGGSRGIPNRMGERGFESRANHLAHEKRGRVIAPLVLRSSGSITPSNTRPSMSGATKFRRHRARDGEVKSLEQLVERVAATRCCSRQLARAAVQAEGSKSPPLRNGSCQRPARLRPLRRWAIQRAKAQRVEEGAMKVSAGRERPVEQTHHVSCIAVSQPSLDEIEEEHPREPRECERVTIHTRPRGRQRAQ